MKQTTTGFHNCLQRYMLLFKPDTLLKWNRELVKHKWTFRRRKQSGHPRIDPEHGALVVRIAQGTRWGYKRIHGELVKLGFVLDSNTVCNVLMPNGILPAPQRRRSLWHIFLSQYKQQLFACDFFKVETISLKRLHMLFFIELDRRRVHFARITANLIDFWTTSKRARSFGRWRNNCEPFDFSRTTKIQNHTIVRQFVSFLGMDII